jgi:hypothetical protein
MHRATSLPGCSCETARHVVYDRTMVWAIPRYSPAQVDAAGDVLNDDSANAADFDAALEVVNNWRSCHSFPLNTLQMALRRKAGTVSVKHVNPLVAQRIKRLPAIIHKLKRLPKLKLSVLQDIGGCRAVMGDIKLVHALRTAFSATQMRHELVAEDDYLAKPKKSGYRGIHLVYAYRSDRTTTFDGLKIEIQLRSRLQHAWATAVETVGMFSAQYLKSSQGDPNWLRFFVLMGSVIALRENATLVPGTHSTPRDLIAELKLVADELDARRRLVAYGQALKLVEPDSGSYFLLQLDSHTEKLTVTGYRRNDLATAEADYARVERSAMGNPGADAVLVSVDSVKLLRAAYPNYFADTKRFVEILDAAVH